MTRRLSTVERLDRAVPEADFQSQVLQLAGLLRRRRAASMTDTPASSTRKGQAMTGTTAPDEIPAPDEAHDETPPDEAHDKPTSTLGALWTPSAPLDPWHNYGRGTIPLAIRKLGKSSARPRPRRRYPSGTTGPPNGDRPVTDPHGSSPEWRHEHDHHHRRARPRPATRTLLVQAVAFGRCEVTWNDGGLHRADRLRHRLMTPLMDCTGLSEATMSRPGADRTTLAVVERALDTDDLSAALAVLRTVPAYEPAAPVVADAHLTADVGRLSSTVPPSPAPRNAAGRIERDLDNVGDLIYALNAEHRDRSGESR